jgi:hypothetical protein
MSVAELIAKLQVMPADAKVEYFQYDDYQDDPVSYNTVEDVELNAVDGIQVVQLS